MTVQRIVKNTTGVEKTETINGLLREVNTLDGKPVLKPRSK